MGKLGGKAVSSERTKAMTEAESGRPSVSSGQDRRQAAGNERRISEFISTYGLVIVFVCVLLGFASLRPHTFLTINNINNILISQSVTALLALAVMVPLATRHFDLSIGYHVGLAQVLVVGLQINQNISWELSVIIVIIIGALVGIFNGLLVTIFRIDSFIATMGSGTLLYGISNWYTQGQQIVGLDLPQGFISLSQLAYGIPLPAVIVAVIAIALWIATEFLPFGRNLYVIGANPRAAALTGIHVDRFVAGSFVVSGILCGTAGILLGSVLQTGTPSVGPEYLLPAFAGALLGATSIKPGRVNVIGTILGILILAFSFSGVQQMGASFYIEYFFNGGLLIIAVGLSVYAAARRRKLASANGARR